MNRRKLLKGLLASPAVLLGAKAKAEAIPWEGADDSPAQIRREAAATGDGYTISYSLDGKTSYKVRYPDAESMFASESSHKVMDADRERLRRWKRKGRS